MNEKMELAYKILGYVTDGCFTDVNIDHVVSLFGEERNAFVLEQADRLIDEASAYRVVDGERYSTPNKACWLAEQFWNYEPDEGSYKHSSNPLFDEEVLRKLGDVDRAKADFYVDLSHLCSDLYNHCLYDTEMLHLADQQKDLDINNSVLVDWLETTPLVHVAMHVAYTMKYNQWELAFDMKNQTLQDYLAKLRNKEHHVTINAPEVDGIPPREYIRTILDALRAIGHKDKERERLGLTLEEMYLHDEICGEFVPEFNEVLIPYVRELYRFLCDERKKYDFDNIKLGLTPSEQPEPIKGQIHEYSRTFINKVCEVRDKLGHGWLEDDSIGIDYLLYHVEYKAYDRYDEWE